MKKIIQTSLLFFLIVSLGSCEKSETSESISGNSLVGQKYENVEALIYEIAPNDDGNCEGWFLQSVNPKFEFLIQIEDGLLDNIKNHQGLDTTLFFMDLSFTGRNYYCEKPYRKKVDPGNSYPYEIQMVSISNVSENLTVE